MKLIDRVLFVLTELSLTDETLFMLAKLLKLTVDRAVDKTADRIVCETAVINKIVNMT